MFLSYWRNRIKTYESIVNFDLREIHLERSSMIYCVRYFCLRDDYLIPCQSRSPLPYHIVRPLREYSTKCKSALTTLAGVQSYTTINPVHGEIVRKRKYDGFMRVRLLNSCPCWLGRLRSRVKIRTSQRTEEQNEGDAQESRGWDVSE